MGWTALEVHAEQAAAPLDHLRRLCLSLLARNPLLIALLTRRETRIHTLVVVQTLIAFGAAVYAPVLLFALVPIVLGVAHVAADVRYLVLRRSLPGWWQHSVWLGCAALIAVRVLEELRVLRSAAAIEFSLAAVFVALAIGAGLTHISRNKGAPWRALLALIALGAATWAALLQPAVARLVFVHAHNGVALVLWVYLYARRRSTILPVTLVLVCAALLGSGLLHRLTLASIGVSSLGLHVLAVSDWIAPFATPSLAIGGVCAYVFLQSIHYGVWLMYVPQEELGRQASSTFRRSLRSLFTDLGRWGVLAVALTMLVVFGGAFVDVHRTRNLYLSLAMFHGYLELAMLAYFFVARTGPRHERPLELAAQ